MHKHQDVVVKYFLTFPARFCILQYAKNASIRGQRYDNFLNIQWITRRFYQKKKYFGKINSLDTICLQSRTITNTIFLSPSIIDVFHKGQTLYIAPKLLYTRTCQNMKVIHNSDMFLYVTYFIEK